MGKGHSRDQTAIVITKTALLLTLLAAYGAHSDQPDKEPPPEPPQDGQAFCCISVDKKTKSGEGCRAISTEHINTCDKVLHCAGDYIKEDAVVTCL